MYLLWVILCVGFSRRVRGYVLFFSVISSCALFSVCCDFMGGWLCGFIVLGVLCVCVGNIVEVMIFHG